MSNLFSKENLFVIAEIGHNHQGLLEKAFKLFDAAKDCGANAVKLQKRHNSTLFTNSFFNKPYDHANSYAKTYGKHRQFLEFGMEEYVKLKKYAKKIKIDFFATPFDLPSLEFLEKLKMPYYKIASADLTNPILQSQIAKTGKHIFLSTGGGTYKEIDDAKKTIFKFNKKLTILQCTASYPCNFSEMNLNVIKVLKNKYKDCSIGLSDHENGIDAGPIAYMLGARVFEKHFTLDRASKGTDHAFSLEPNGLKKFIRNLKRVDLFLGTSNKSLLKSEEESINKMRKSIVASQNLPKGKKINLSDLAFKAPGDGAKPSDYKFIIGKKTKKAFTQDDLIFKKDVY